MRLKWIGCLVLSVLLTGCWQAVSIPPSPTAMPSPVTQPTVTYTPVVTSTVTSVPAQDESTPTMIPTPALTASISSTPIVTLTALPTEELSLIVSFTAEPAEIDPGDQVTLTWETTANTVTLCTTMRGGSMSECWEVDASGTRTISTHELDRVYEMYLLFAESGDVKEQASTSVTIRCPDTWFFANPPDGCPYAAVYSQGAIQHFEHGIMIWAEELDAIFVLHADEMFSPRWERHPDQWEPGMAESDPSIIPPEGLYQPVRGFGLVWREPEGATITIRDRLGWATGQEIAIDTAYQCDTAPKYNTCYLLGPEGVIVLEPERSGWHLYNNAE